MLACLISSPTRLLLRQTLFKFLSFLALETRRLIRWPFAFTFAISRFFFLKYVSSSCFDSVHMQIALRSSMNFRVRIWISFYKPRRMNLMVRRLLLNIFNLNLKTKLLYREFIFSDQDSPKFTFSSKSQF